MFSPLRLGFAFVFLLAMGAGLIWLWPSASPYPTQQSIEGLSGEASIEWAENGTATVTANEHLDRLAALGYVHGLKRGWTVTLWRRTALGTLSEWFGAGLVPLDRHARRLGLARHARQSYQQLPSATKRQLRAYSRGMNAALERAPDRHDPFLLLDVQPHSWKPWHSLAVERLLAWVSSSPPTADTTVTDTSVTTFQAVDRRFRRWLHLHGWERSVAWAAGSPSSNPSRTVLFRRQVLGASAVPIVQEVTVRAPNAPSHTMATLPGLPLPFMGTTPERSWTVLLHSSSQLQRVPLDSSRLSHWYQRLTPLREDEQLIRVQRLDDALFLGRASRRKREDSDTVRSSAPTTASALTDTTTRTPPDTVQKKQPPQAWVVRWPGLTTSTDVSTWIQLSNPGTRPPADSLSFQLFQGEGLFVHPDGQWQVRGNPPVVAQDSAGTSVVVGRSNWTVHQAQSLQAHLSENGTAVARWSVSDSSTWAAGLLPGMLPALSPLPSTDSLTKTAVTYLRNWNYTYDPSSVGASVFEAWMRAYRNEIGHTPRPPDTTYFGAYRQRRAFERALATLESTYGNELSRWRWERVAPDQRFFPVWSADSLVSADLASLSTTRYAPINRPGRGHPSSLAGGPSLVDPLPTAPSPTVWNGWTKPSTPGLTVRRLRFDPSSFFARSKLEEERPRPTPVPPASPDAFQTTQLVPPDS